MWHSDIVSKCDPLFCRIIKKNAIGLSNVQWNYKNLVKKLLFLRSLNHSRGICALYSLVDHYSHMFLCWTRPWGHSDQTVTTQRFFFFHQRGIHRRVHSNLFLSVNAAQLYCSLDHDLRAVHGTLATETLCSPPDRDPIAALDPHSPPFIFN